MSSQQIEYHRRFSLSASNELVEVDAGPRPARGSIAAQFEHLLLRQRALNERLTGPKQIAMLTAPVTRAGIYPLSVTSFTVSCEGADYDGAAAQLIDRLGNLRVITHVPFMQRGQMIFAIRSQGLFDPVSGEAESVDALFNGGIYWRGRITPDAYEYELLMFKKGKDTFVGRMSEVIDLRTPTDQIDADLFQAEVAYHLDRESNGPDGLPTLPRPLELYASPEHVAQIAECYEASGAFGRAVARGETELDELALAARNACVVAPGKRYYQAYDAWLRGISYDASTRA